MKLLCSDFDGTLHYRTAKYGYIRDVDRQAVTKFRKDGNLFAICTGRPLSGLLNDIKNNLDVDYCITSTGARISSSADVPKKIIMEERITAEDCISIQKRFHQKGVLFIHAENAVHTFAYTEKGYPEQHVLKDLKSLNDLHITGISIRCETDEISREMTEEINRDYPDVAAFQNRNWLDVVKKGVSKGNGALYLKEHVHADLLGGIGDSFNDIPLLKAADVSFTFHTSPDEVQKEADYLVESEAEAVDILNHAEDQYDRNQNSERKHH